MERTIQGIELSEDEYLKAVQVYKVFGKMKNLLLDGANPVPFDEYAKMATLRIATYIVNKAA
ncbi:MAG: hypothetical protein WCO55_01370 [Candidatus Falkowbacteria bacterium]